jgi:hypothetical protein
MTRILTSFSVLLVMTLSSFGVATAVAAAGEPIGPDQHFIGLVNGSNDNPIVYTVCPGPEWEGRRGQVLQGQKLSVAKVANGDGYTGLFSQVYAWFAPTKASAGPRQIKFKTYGRSKNIPDSVRVPCDGEGTVVFSSCPYAAPCAAGWVVDEVAVQFVNIAV